MSDLNFSDALRTARRLDNLFYPIMTYDTPELEECLERTYRMPVDVKGYQGLTAIEYAESLTRTYMGKILNEYIKKFPNTTSNTPSNEFNYDEDYALSLIHI